MVSNEAYIFPLWTSQKLYHNPNHLFLEKSISLNRIIDCIRVKGSNFKFGFYVYTLKAKDLWIPYFRTVQLFSDLNKQTKPETLF